MAIRVLTDSSAVLPPDQRKRYGVEIVPLTITWGEESFDNGDLPYEEFERRVASSGQAPTTSAPSPGAYEQAYARLLAGADGLLVVTPPAEVSATHHNAALAAGLSDTGAVRVVDSRSAAGGQGLVVLEAAKAAAAGAALDGVEARAQEVAKRVALWATLERLDYLKRSGRVPAVAAFANDALNLHPVFRFVDGSPQPAGVTRGGRRAAVKLLDAWARSTPEAPGRTSALVFHSSRAAEAAELRDRIVERDPQAETAVVAITAAMAAHIGPGMLGLAWFREAGSES